MKRPTIASLKKVTPENLAGLGADRLAEILVDIAATRPDLKRRLRMELAARQGPEHLAAEIDKRLGSLETSGGKIGWRQRPAFVRDLDALRNLIAHSLAGLDMAAAVERLWRFMDVARPIGRRVKDREGAIAAVFAEAAADLGRLIAGYDAMPAAGALVEAVERQPSAWAEWLPGLLRETSAPIAQQALRLMSERGDALPTRASLIRQLADAAGDVDAFRASYSDEALTTPHVATEVGGRLLRVGRIDEAGRLLAGAAPRPSGRNGRLSAPDFDWESAWIAYLDQAGQAEDAQAVRWASFERTLSVERAKDFTQRLADFDDVEAEGRAFSHAAQHPDFARGLRFLMTWPALPEAAQMILARADEVQADPQDAETWAARLRRRWPAAAQVLLRKVAAAAFRRREFMTCDRLTHEADSITVEDEAAQ